MSLVQWNPFRELGMLDTPFDRLVQSVPAGATGPVAWSWMPAVDVYETDDHALVISAELPGVDRDAVNVTLENGVLTIAGERKLDEKAEAGRLYRSERAYGSFRRSFRVPSTVNVAAVTAEHRDGTLRITLPLQEAAKPHRIDIKAA